MAMNAAQLILVIVLLDRMSVLLYSQMKQSQENYVGSCMAKDRVDAVDRALGLLEAFREPGEDITLAELAKRTGLYKSTILRLLGSLLDFGFVVRRGNGTYRLGASLWRLGSLYQQAFLPAEMVRPVLRDLASTTGETASFYIQEGDERICLYLSNAPRALRHHLNEGARLPLDRGAAGRLLSAFADPTDPTSKQVLIDGHTVSLGERDEEVAAIAVPVIEPSGTCAGALTISGPIGRFTPEMLERCLPLLSQSAQQLSSALSR